MKFRKNSRDLKAWELLLIGAISYGVGMALKAALLIILGLIILVAALVTWIRQRRAK
jgi:L-lactate permease